MIFIGESYKQLPSSSSMSIGKMFNIFTTGLGIEDRNAVIKYVGDTNLDNYQYRGGKR